MQIARNGHAGTGRANRIVGRPLETTFLGEASEHVLTFDWADVARQVGAVYRELVRPPSLRSG